MKDITPIVNKYKAKYASKYCGLDDISQCKKSPCSCSLAAEISAYIEGIIPPEFHSCSLHNFDGVTKGGDVVLSSQEALSIKNKITKLCWNKTVKEIINLTPRELDACCVIGDRRENGENVAIYGGSKEKIGRSIIAALIMKSAIRQRVDPARYLDSYGWVEFPVLKNLLRGKSDSTESQEAFEYKIADWLVVDNIDSMYYSSPGQETFTKDVIDTFFYDRIYQKRSTILIFRVDITLSPYKEGFEKLFGKAMKQIVFSDKSHHICIAHKK